MLIVADNLQITNPEIAEAIDALDPEPIVSLVKRCLAAGADAIDINPGPLKKAPGDKMRFLVKTVASVTDRPLLLDTTNPAAIEAGLAVCKNPVIINGFSLEPEKREHILPLAKAFDADIIGYLLYPNSHVPTDETDCFSIALELLAAVDSAGVERRRLIIDPVVAPLMWENGIAHNLSLLSILRNLSDLMGFSVRTIAGVSNLTTGPGPREQKRLAERAFVPMLTAAGLDMALVNVFHAETIRTARAGSALVHEGIFSWAALDA